ncbi:extensin family protein [Aliiroseovarius sp. Z3]|uniref:extensin-like domain-containing protein n=1 Tax=Aliiroseovarius sp. Z3 TaxID=2811402 RepID=UPI0023B319FE|nr:extensin family protein [Aliiroseovarius sp. Z3]MDE9450113.1 extensin family protein [Aliiroseovarius sp. Z3]
MNDEPQRRPVFRRAALSVLSALFSAVLLGLVAMWFLLRPGGPLPDHWNPTKRLTIGAPVTVVTRLQMMRALDDVAECRSVLDQAGVVFDPMSDLEVDENCGIEGRGLLSTLPNSRMNRVETRCETALRLAMWEEHVVQPAAREVLGSEVAAITQIGSYNCRKMRTSRGTEGRWSSHAKANAIDITGVRLADGRQLSLLKDWDGDGPEAAFLRRIWRGSCDWFRLVLGPDYNQLHADHFHLENTGWGYCR